MESEPPKVFISYNRAAIGRSGSQERLNRLGYKPFIQAWHYRAGENFVLRMQEGAA